VAALKATLSGRSLAAVGALDRLLTTHAQLLLSRNRWAGVFALAAAASAPRCLVLGLVALLGTTAAVRGLRLSTRNIYVPYAYNALLVGYVLGREYACDGASLAFALALGVLSALVTASLSSLVGYIGWVPILTLPFIVTSWFALGVAPHVSLSGALPVLDAFAGSGHALPHALSLLLQSLGSCLFIPTVTAGICVLAGLLVFSRIASVLALGATALALGLLEFTHAPVADELAQLTACNAALAAVALGGIWLVPSRRSFLLAFAGALLAAFFALGFVRPLERLGLSLGFVPWNAVVILVLSALRQRPSNDSRLRLAEIASDSPEQLLLADIGQRVLKGTPTAVPLHLPFRGVWNCTQGVDGVYTHRGTLRHAFDFEVYGELDGSLCTGEGLRVEDYRCFGLPVLAAADGTVVATEGDLPNNAVGEEARDKPWGNHVTLLHAAGLYSVVAHLSPATIAVYPGQYVRRGTVLGYLGNSGRSPRPHLHFQLQSAQHLGSETLPCRFIDVLVRTGDQTSFQPGHVPHEGEALRALEPDYALAAYFDLPLGARFTYRIGERIERLQSEQDDWGRPMLRSLDLRSELAFVRTDGCFSCAELRGSQRSLLSWLRLSVSRVPYEREPGVTFRSLLPQRWLGGWLRTVRWDLTAPFARSPGIELTSRLELDGERLTILGSSRERTRSGAPLIETRAELTRGVGPTLIEVIVDGRAQRAELLTSDPRALAPDSRIRASVHPALGLGDWS
jgi:murein DD-endopeptidase MepM/ murein hydrolase activator NlpD